MLAISLSKEEQFSSLVANSSSTSATIVFSTVFTQEIVIEEPSILNSNLFPVNANGEVLFLSLESAYSCGNVGTPKSINLFLFSSPCVMPDATFSKTLQRGSPRQMDITAGGASNPPSLWSLLAEAVVALSSPAFKSIALITADTNNRNLALSYGFSPGSRRLVPVSVQMDQLLCLPLPFIYSKGFSWSRQIKSCCNATLTRVSIIS